MVWNNAGEFLHMGGYGLYVWGSVTVTFGLMLVEVLILRARRLAALKSLGAETGRDDDGQDDAIGGELKNGELR